VGVQWAGEDLRMSFVWPGQGSAMWSDWLPASVTTVFRNRTNLAKLKLTTSRVVIYDWVLTLVGADCNWNLSCALEELRSTFSS